MKKVFFMMSFALMAFAVTSCSNEEESVSLDEIVLKTQVDEDVFNSVSIGLSDYFSHNTRSADIKESEVQEILSPLVEKGTEIRDEIVQLGLNHQLEMSKEEISAWENMADSELAGLAYTVHAIVLSCDETGEEIERSISWRDVGNCISFAIGLEAISGFWGYVDGTAGLITARTAWQIGSKFITRTLGWIGVAHALYEFGNCLYEKKLEETEVS